MHAEPSASRSGGDLGLGAGGSGRTGTGGGGLAVAAANRNIRKMTFGCAEVCHINPEKRNLKVRNDTTAQQQWVTEDKTRDKKADLASPPSPSLTRRRKPPPDDDEELSCTITAKMGMLVHFGVKMVAAPKPT